MGRRAGGPTLSGPAPTEDRALVEVLAGPVVPAARRLLGCRLTAHGVTVRLTEVEAYAGEADPGSHAFRGRTPRTAVMFGPSGHAYVYFTYGMHWCLNVVCGADGVASAVLVRAGEVVDGVGTARERRPGAPGRDLARGPARLTRALGVTGADRGVALLTGGTVRLEAAPPVPPSSIAVGPRVGVGGDGAGTPWRFWVADDPTVSPYRPAASRRRATGTAGTGTRSTRAGGSSA